MRALVNGTELFYVTSGRGRPALVMHGGPGFDHAYLRPWLDPLSEHAQLIFYDHRGNGRSGQPDDWSEVTHATWAADADALRARLGIDRWSVFGHSYGGYIALEYALRYPERLERLILYSTAPAFKHAEAALALAREQGAAPEQLAVLAEALAAPIESDAAFEAGWRMVASVYFHRPTPARVAAVTEGAIYCADAFNRGFFGCLPAYDVRARLHEIDVPALVLGGLHDWICPPAHGAEVLARGLPHADLVLFEESGHYPFIEEPRRFAEVATRWLRSGSLS